MTLRVNPLRATVGDVAAELTAAGVVVARGALIDDALLVTGTGDIRVGPYLYKLFLCIPDGRQFEYFL